MKNNIFKLRSSSSCINKKKKGFTIIELIVVMAIMAILAVVITPKIGGYINQAKKTQVVAEMRDIVIAVESYNVKAIDSDSIKDSSLYSSIKTKLIAEDYLEAKSNDVVTDDISFEAMKKIVEGTKQFNIEKDKDGKAVVVVQK